LAFTLASLLIGLSPGFTVLLAGFIIFYPASGAFVSISQASLMDRAPKERELNMARWGLAGTLGNIIGPLLFGATVAIGAGWRPVFGLIAALSLGLTLILQAKKAGSPLSTVSVEENANDSPPISWNLIRRSNVWRRLLLLESSDLMLDVFRAFLALFLVETGSASPAFAALAVGMQTSGWLVGGAVMPALLRRVSGALYLRVSSLIILAVYPLFIFIGPLELKLCPLFIIGLLTAGWYPVLKAGLYAELPGQSGSVMALSSAAGFAGGLIPIGLGMAADLLGLRTAMWFLLLAPVILLLGTPTPRQK
jgi:FSR family fosmidomycin resistance protein-like MFS transporter